MQIPSLAETYADSFRIGVSLNNGQIAGKNPSVQALIDHQFNTYTAESGMKWSNIQPSEGVFDFTYADALVELGERNNATIIGHTLVWHTRTPDWAFQDEDGQPADEVLVLSLLQAHCDAVAGRYAGRIYG